MNRHYTVNSAAAAWSKANELFPTDYELDIRSTERAGYPIYRSTADGHYYDYICDLNTRLELNLSTGETVNIWIKEDETPRIEETLSWDSEAVRQLCIKEGFYTDGSNEDYINLLDFVDVCKVTHATLYRVAKNIEEHSVLPSSMDTARIMSKLRSIVKTTYTLN